MKKIHRNITKYILKQKGNQAHIPRGDEDKEIERCGRKQGELEMVILVSETLSIFLLMTKEGGCVEVDQAVSSLTTAPFLSVKSSTSCEITVTHFQFIFSILQSPFSFNPTFKSPLFFYTLYFPFCG